MEGCFQSEPVIDMQANNEGRQTSYPGNPKTVLALLLDFDMYLNNYVSDGYLIWEGLPQKLSGKKKKKRKREQKQKSLVLSMILG